MTEDADHARRLELARQVLARLAGIDKAEREARLDLASVLISCGIAFALGEIGAAGVAEYLQDRADTWATKAAEPGVRGPLH